MSCDDQNGNKSLYQKACDCNTVLKEHLKKCAGYGQPLPPLIDNCEAANAPNCGPGPCGGPAKCKKKSNPCGNSMCSSKKLEEYIPKYDLPPTATFKCPAYICTECPPKKPKCPCPPPPEPPEQCPQPQCPMICTADGKCKAPGDNGNCPPKDGGCPAPPKPPPPCCPPPPPKPPACGCPPPPKPPAPCCPPPPPKPPGSGCGCGGK